jgi:hypothetical protein
MATLSLSLSHTHSSSFRVHRSTLSSRLSHPPFLKRIMRNIRNPLFYRRPSPQDPSPPFPDSFCLDIVDSFRALYLQACLSSQKFSQRSASRRIIAFEKKILFRDVEICEDFDGESITLELEGSHNIDNVNDKRVGTRI